MKSRVSQRNYEKNSSGKGSHGTHAKPICIKTLPVHSFPLPNARTMETRAGNDYSTIPPAYNIPNPVNRHGSSSYRYNLRR